MHMPSHNHTPLVTVVIPTWNDDQYISEAIQSILKQTFTDFELIIANDGSTDNTPVIAEKFAKQDDRIIILNKPHSNGSIIRNHALEITRGQFTAVMDADDYSDHTRLEKQVNFLLENPDHVAVGSWFVRVDPEGNTLGMKMLPETHEEIDSLHIEGNAGAIAHSSLMYRTDAFRDIGGYSERPCATDYDLALKLAEKGRIANLPEVLYYWRQHLKSTSSNKSIEQARCAFQAWIDARNRRDLPIDHNTAERLGDEIKTMKPATKAQILSLWSRYALHYGELPVARKHAMHALARNPFCLQNWRIFKWSLTG
ncbi:Putative glycosyltransferase EpsE [Poriferisphaera corsica]|uniref:Glycosyltransferase EpsE n=1 Tax=Poriferisphaera corsica TaxID=2528020 RepID=A0A517YW91_9BACT|nr:glycosyltransferase family A protein [Poriferisphaera corsica]QDU34452.1 Putative glycosyltransferase EpsE [Poriferisphaera corsica]